MTAREIIESMTKEDALNLWMDTVNTWAECEGGNKKEFITEERIRNIKNKFKVSYNTENPNWVKIEEK